MPPKRTFELCRFPAAKIKRIMRSDEEVGKLAQATPVLISKAVEMFCVGLTRAAALEASARGAKRVSSVHVKRSVEALSDFDFLKAKVGRIADPSPVPSAFPPGFALDITLPDIDDGKKRKRTTDDGEKPAKGSGKKKRTPNAKTKAAADDDYFEGNSTSSEIPPPLSGPPSSILPRSMSTPMGPPDIHTASMSTYNAFQSPSLSVTTPIPRPVSISAPLASASLQSPPAFFQPPALSGHFIIKDDDEDYDEDEEMSHDSFPVPVKADLDEAVFDNSASSSAKSGKDWFHTVLD